MGLGHGGNRVLGDMMVIVFVVVEIVCGEGLVVGAVKVVEDGRAEVERLSMGVDAVDVDGDGCSEVGGLGGMDTVNVDADGCVGVE